MSGNDLSAEIQRQIEAYALTVGLPYDHPDFFHDFQPESDGWDVSNAYTLARLSVLAYQDEALVRKRLADFSGVSEECFVWLEDKKCDTQGFAVKKEKQVFVVFRGSESRRDWLQNIQIEKVPTEFTGKEEMAGGIHKGFKGCFEAIWNDLRHFLCIHLREERKVWFAGHSLGGALATIACAKSACEYGRNAIGGLITFGQPRVVSHEFQSQMLRVLGRSKIHRVYRCADPVPILPIGYKHVSGNRCYISRNGVFLEGTKSIRKWWERSLHWTSTSLKARALENWPELLHETISHHYKEGYLSALRNAKRALKNLKSPKANEP